MEISNMKNMVVLKNLPSNLVDEAIIVLKANKKAKKLQYIDNGTSFRHHEKNNTNDYVVKEAESIISNYISKLEKEKNKVKKDRNISKKYKMLKAYSIIISILFIITLIRSLI